MADRQNPPGPAHQPATRKGEEMVRETGNEPGRHHTGTTGANRPAGKANPRIASGIVSKGPVDPQSPYLQPA
jgi:hypothetical protein